MLINLCLCMIVVGIELWYTGIIFSGVSVAGINVGEMVQYEAEDTLQTAWATDGILLRDGDRTWHVDPAELGLTINAEASAKAAYDWGRSNGGIPARLQAFSSGVTLDPVLHIDLQQITTYFQNNRFMLETPAVNAGVRLVNGQAVASRAQEGRALNIAATVERLRLNAADELSDGAIDLIMTPTYPAITDAAPLVVQANALLNSPFTVQAYDPIRDEWHDWTAQPELWATWLTAESDPASPTGLTLSMGAAGPEAFLMANGSFTDERFIDTNAAVADMQHAITQNTTSIALRVWHDDTTYTVRAGQTLAAIAEELGVPYPYIQAANPGVNTDALLIGQLITIPSRDILVPMQPIPHKRIIISRSQQHLWAYEHGQMVFDWVISTGISSSPTALGIFQVQSHNVNAYADQWNLYMPHFMGFYHPGPNMALWNGFHGFPTRGGGYLLWSGDLGHPVTYGCVLLSLENAETLYTWAEEGVVVEVRA
ncbi:MAG: L,D-transpeptidase family protein [Anaerolineae bacterium]|nr:L,D-transpeptidase family protein [Anaerolineae bacterium]